MGGKSILPFDAKWELALMKPPLPPTPFKEETPASEREKEGERAKAPWKKKNAYKWETIGILTEASLST